MPARPRGRRRLRVALAATVTAALAVVGTAGTARADDSRAEVAGTARPAHASGLSPVARARLGEVTSRSMAARTKLAAAPPSIALLPLRLQAMAASLDWHPPVSGTRFTSKYGPRWGRLHAGVDFAGPVGTAVRAPTSGVVTFAGRQPGYGNKVEVTCWDGTLVVFGHLHGITVGAGDVVVSGQRVATLGNTGHSTGPHLHFEVRPDGTTPIDPLPWLAARDAVPPR